MSVPAAVPSPGGMAVRRRLAIGLGIPGAAVVAGILAGALVAGGHIGPVLGLVVVLAPPILLRRPYLAPAAVLLSALLIEQSPDNLGLPLQNITGTVPLFHGLGALHLSPADLLLAGACALAFAKRRGLGVQTVPRTPVTAAVTGMTVAVAIGLVLGIAHHGAIRVSFMEIRPWIYFGGTYFVASSLLNDRRAIRALLWAIVIDGAVKGTQAVAIFISARHMYPPPDAVLSHEEALFLGLALTVGVALWIFDVRGRLRSVATWALPLIVLGDLANARRTAWLILGGGLIVLAAVGYKCVPVRRVLITRLIVFTCLGLALYMPVYWNRTGFLAQPARAIRSIVTPSTRDASSDLYRVQEDANLKVNIRTGGLVGRGYGVEIDYPLPIVDISSIDPLIAYVPHNGILYILMRTGLLGGIMIWCLIGTAIVAGCRLARAADRELAAVGAVVVATMVGYAFEGALDQGFFLYRVGFAMGSVLGLLEAARRLHQRAAHVPGAPPRGRELAVPR